MADTIPAFGELQPLLERMPSEGAALELLGRVLGSLPLAVAVYDASDGDFRAVYLNPIARQLTSHRGEAAGQPFTDLYPYSRESGALEVFEQVRSSGVTQVRRRYGGPSGRTWIYDTFLIGDPGPGSYILAVGQEVPAPTVDLETLVQSTQATWLPLSPRDLAARAASQGRHLVEGVECMLTLVDVESPQTLEIVAGAGTWAESLVGTRLAAEGTFSGQAIAQLASVETTEASANSSAHKYLAGGAIDTLRVVPLTTGEPFPDGRRALGVIGFYRAGRSPFQTSERLLMDEFGRWITLSLHRAELLEAANAAARRLQVGVDIALDLGASLDSRTVIDRLLERALDAVAADRVTLLRVDGEETVIEGSRDRDPARLQFEPGTRHRIFASVFKRMLADRQPAVETYDVDEFPEELKPSASGSRHSLTVPMLEGGTVFAALAAMRRSDQPFRSEDVATLQQIGTVAGLALRNAGLFSEVEESRDRARAIARSLRLGVEVAVDLASQLDPDEVVRRLLRRVTTAVSADRGSLSLVDGDTVVVMDAHSREGNPALPGSRWKAPPGTLVGEAIRTQRPFQVSRGDVAFEVTDQIGGVDHGLAVPLAVQGQVLYVLGLARTTGPPFTEEEIATLHQVGNVAVLSLRNAQLYRAKTDFMNLAAHELRTPLAVLSGYMSMLQDGTFGAPSATWEKPITVLAGKTRELGQLVENLLVGARLDSGHLAGSRTRIDLVALVKDAVLRAQPRLNLLDGTLEVSLSAEPVWVEGDPEQLGRILDNLINNSLTYSDGNPALTVTVKGGETAEVTVADRGRGIPTELHERVFEQFYRVEEIQPGNAAGTGLGLYISRRLAARHGGTLAIASSTPGEGSIFLLRLPAV